MRKKMTECTFKPMYYINIWQILDLLGIKAVSKARGLIRSVIPPTCVAAPGVSLIHVSCIKCTVCFCRHSWLGLYCRSAVREMQECPLMAAWGSAHCCCHLFIAWRSDCVCVCVCVCGLGYMNHSLSQWGGGVCTDRESRCSLLLEDTQSTQIERERWRERETNQWRCYKNSRASFMMDFR